MTELAETLQITSIILSVPAERWTSSPDPTGYWGAEYSVDVGDVTYTVAATSYDPEGRNDYVSIRRQYSSPGSPAIEFISAPGMVGMITRRLRRRSDFVRLTTKVGIEAE